MSINSMLEQPPRFSFEMLDIAATATGLDADLAGRLSRIRVRALCGDPIEELRDAYLFAATRSVGDVDLFAYMSLGIAEQFGEQEGWPEILADAFGRGLAYLEAHPEAIGSEVLAPPEALTLPPVPLESADLEFTAIGWRPWDLSAVVDIAENDVGSRGHRTEILEPEDYGEPSCPSCRGQRIDVILDSRVRDGLCEEHLFEFDSLQADALLVETDAGREVMKLMFARERLAAATGFYHRCMRYEEGDSSAEQLLEWIAEHFEGHEGILDDATEDLDFADTVYRAMTEACGVNPVRGVELCRRIADLADTNNRWLYEMTYLDALIELERVEEAEALLTRWLEQADRSDWLIYGAIGELLEQWGEHATAVVVFRRLLGTSVAAGDESSATYALARLEHNARTAEQADTEAQASELKQTIEARGLPAVRPGRNEACICGSGRKFKRCCAAANRTAHPTVLTPN